MNDTSDQNIPRLGLRPAEAARALGISPRKLWAITADQTSDIPHVRIGKAIIYPAHQLQVWLESQAAKGVRNADD